MHAARHSVLTLVAAGIALGALITLGIDYSLYVTGTDEFCGTCHANNATREWRESAHRSNPAGFVAGCTDCHLPREFIPKLIRKTKGATVEIWGQITGLIDTPEKYEAHRREMAEVEWTRLRANGAQECRNCHQPNLMTDKDKAYISGMHKDALASGQICIDCHKGVAHRAPNQVPGAARQK
jgi:cytochrome c-type protein NapC